jgi:hypothetical protein
VEKAADAAVAARIELQNAQLQLRDLEAYNRYMQSLVADQQNELGKLSQQLEAVQETRQGLSADAADAGRSGAAGTK